jgi:transcription-repair coupling factor (superfamily II helicase)
MNPNLVELSDIVLSGLNSKFLKEKIRILDKEPLFLKNTERNLLGFSGTLLSKISDKSFDIVLCKDEDELNQVIQQYCAGRNEGLRLKISDSVNAKDFEEANFQRVKRVWEKGEYSLLGDVLVVWPFNSKNPIRLSLFNKSVESIDVVDKSSFRSLDSLNSVELYLSLNADVTSYNSEISKKYKYPIFFIGDRVAAFGYESLDLGFRNISGLDYYLNNKRVVSRVIDEYIKNKFRVVCSSKNVKKVGEIMGDRKFYISVESFKKGFVNNQSKVLLLTDYELFGQISLGEEDEWLKNILPGDFLVHEDHGIGAFEGIVSKGDESYIDIRYAGKDVLLVPITQSVKITKYVGGKGKVPVLTTLNSGVWKRTKRKARADTENLARELLQIYALRKTVNVSLDVKKEKLKEKFNSFVEDFDFEDTFDQKIITKEIFDEMTNGSLMDRLLVGDVGFGKTEIAMRAAFLALSTGLQVAVLAPTTILVSQHSSVFKNRLSKYGFKVDNLSRLSKGKDRDSVIQKLEKGEVDLIVGTHSLLSDRVKFKNLGLVIIDEEQKFGVKQKEKLKEKRLESHFLSMSATPIPRSMNMALSGIREISMLFTPPAGRKAILNRFEPFDWSIVKIAIRNEVNRGGQVYFLHNRVFDIQFVEQKLNELFPDLEIGVLHGQLSASKIAKVMDAFCEGKIDVLISTTIIENGLDLPNVNTLIVDDASMFGLSQLYQIRGRIGRADVQAYAYFLYKSMKGDAEQRLDALMEAQDLGSGFLLANRDLEIRGAGDLLGSAQSGNINSVGYGLFMKYLTEAIEKLK